MTQHDTASGKQGETVPNGTATNGQSEKTERNDETERRNVEQKSMAKRTTKRKARRKGETTYRKVKRAASKAKRCLYIKRLHGSPIGVLGLLHHEEIYHAE